MNAARVVAALAIAYSISYGPFAYLIREAGRKHGELAVLPVYSAACLATLATVLALARRHLPPWAPYLRGSWAWIAGAASTAVMYGASWAYMNRAPPVLTAVTMKAGTLFIAALLSGSAASLSAALPLVLTFSAVTVAWLSRPDAFAFSWTSAAGPLLYVVGWTGKMRASGPFKGLAGFLVAESVTTVLISFLVGQGIQLVTAVRGGADLSAWTDPAVWGAGFFSEVTGVLTTAIVLLPGSHGTCMSLSRGASIAAGAVAQAARERVGGWEWVAAAAGAAATVLASWQAGNVSSAAAAPGGVPAGGAAPAAAVLDHQGGASTA